MVSVLVFLIFCKRIFLKSVALSDHLVNLGKTTVCRLCSLHYMYFSDVFSIVFFSAVFWFCLYQFLIIAAMAVLFKK